MFAELAFMVINGMVLSVIFNGTSRLGEALAIVLRFVTDD